MNWSTFWYKILLVASKRVHMRRKHDLIGCKCVMSKNGPKMRSLELAAACCRLDLIRLTKYSLQEFLDVKNNFGWQMCFFWGRNNTWKLKKMIYERNALIKKHKTAYLWCGVCFNDFQTLNIWQHNKSRLAPYQSTCFYVPCPCLDATVRQ